MISIKKKIINLRVLQFILIFRKKNYFYPLRFITWLKYLPKYFLERKKFLASAKEQGLKINFKNEFPVFPSNKKYVPNRHYWIQDIWAARYIKVLSKKSIYKNQFSILDIGSRVEGYVTTILSDPYIDLHFGDINSPEYFKVISSEYKPKVFEVNLQNLKKDCLNSFDAISSLHVIEHLGLGRYGDKIDASGHLKVFKDIYKSIKKGTYFLVSFPVSSSPGVQFNAARDCDPNIMFKTIKKAKWEVEKLDLINDGWEVLQLDTDNPIFPNINYGCMLLVLKK